LSLDKLPLYFFGENNAMTTLIIDRFATQPRYKRILWTSLTLIGWAFWTSLWAPLVGSTELFFGTASQHVASTSHSFGELFAILGSHASAIVVAIGIFLGWSLLQSYGGRKLGLSAKDQTITLRRLAQSVSLSERDLNVWQRTQRMVVTHDEDSGWIRDVNVLSIGAAA
jgi:poly-beta-1,6-N-acetyl-D-glucosamine biosynthesis protein PgaD